MNLSGTTYKRQPSVTEKRENGCKSPKMEHKGEAYCLAGNRVSTDQAGGRRRLGEKDWGGTSKQRMQTGFVQNQKSPESVAVLLTSEIRVCVEASQAAGSLGVCAATQNHGTCTTDSARGSQGKLLASSFGKQFKSQFPHLYSGIREAPTSKVVKSQLLSPGDVISSRVTILNDTVLYI